MKTKTRGYVQKKIDLGPYKHFSIDRISISCGAKTFFTIMEPKYRKSIFHPKHVTGKIIDNCCNLKKKYDLEWNWERWKSNKDRRKCSKKNWKKKKKPCKPTLYIYRNDDEYGEITQRTLTWAPFITIFNLNGNKAVAKYCNKNSIPYKLLNGYDNGFEYIGMERKEHIQVLADLLDLERLKEKVIEPCLEETFGEYVKYFCYFNVCQIEVHYDTIFESKRKAKKAMKLWCLLNHFYFNRNCRISIKASKYKFTYSCNGLQIKGYVKDKAIRFEITLNSKYMNEKINGKTRVDRKDIFSILQEADRLFKRLEEITKPIQTTNLEPSNEDLAILRKIRYSKKDIRMLEAFLAFSISEFKKKDLVEATDMKDGEVRYRLQKLRWMLQLKGKKWIFRIEYRDLIVDVLDSTKRQTYHYSELSGKLIMEFTHLTFITEHEIENAFPPPNHIFSP